MENRENIARMIEETLKEGKNKAAEEKIGGLIDSSLEGAKLPETGETPVDEAFEADDKLDNLVDKEATEKKAKNAAAKTAEKIQQAVEKGHTMELGAIVAEYLGQAQMEGTDEKDARAALKEQLDGIHGSYKEIAETMPGGQFAAKAAEIDSLARSLEAGNEISSEGGKSFVMMLESDSFDDRIEANNAIGKLVEDRKVLGTEVNAIMAKVNEYFDKKEGEVEQKGIEASDEDIDDILGNLG